MSKGKDWVQCPRISWDTKLEVWRKLATHPKNFKLVAELCGISRENVPRLRIELVDMPDEAAASLPDDVQAIRNAWRESIKVPGDNATPQDYYIGQHDDFEITAVLKGTDENGNVVAQNLTGARVVFSMRHEESNRVIVKLSPVTVLDNAAGRVKYTGHSSESAERGLHTGQFKVTFANGDVRRFPNNPKDILRIHVERAIA